VSASSDSLVSSKKSRKKKKKAAAAADATLEKAPQPCKATPGAASMKPVEKSPESELKLQSSPDGKSKVKTSVNIQELIRKAKKKPSRLMQWTRSIETCGRNWLATQDASHTRLLLPCVILVLLATLQLAFAVLEWS
jgi:hypothetical protein